MLKNVSVVVAAMCALAMMGCGGGAQVRIYKGTSTTTITSGGTATTVTNGNTTFMVMPGDMPNEWLFVDNNTSYSGTVNGMALTFQGGNAYSQTSTRDNYSYQVTVSNGTGQLTAESLSVSIAGMITESSTSGGSGSATYTLMFTGARD